MRQFIPASCPRTFRGCLTLIDENESVATTAKDPEIFRLSQMLIDEQTFLRGCSNIRSLTDDCCRMFAHKYELLLGRHMPNAPNRVGAAA